MTTTTLLIFVVASASSLAFSPTGPVARDILMDTGLVEERAYLERDRREIPEDKKLEGSHNLPSAIPSTSFASSGSFSSSSANNRGSLPEGGFGTNSDSSGGNFGSFPGYYGIPASYPFQTFSQQNPVYMPYDFYALFQQFFRQLQLLAQQHAYASNYNTPSIEANTVDYGTGNAGSFEASYSSGYAPPNFFSFPYGGEGSPSVSHNNKPDGHSSNVDGSSFTTPAAGVGGAAAVASLSPQGGFGYADVFPDLSSRFGSVGGEFAKPSGESFGVFTSSASGTSDINGKKTSFKTATTGINDNGKITVFTKHDP